MGVISVVAIIKLLYILYILGYVYILGYEVPIENLELNSGNNSSTSNHQTVNGNTAVIREDGYITLDDIK